jgi:hypothetical protein
MGRLQTRMEIKIMLTDEVYRDNALYCCGAKF